MNRRLGKKSRDDLERIGSDYGGWVIPTSLLDASSVCYCAGVGEDITFDLGLIEHFGCHVWGIDPTPRAAGYVRKMVPDEGRYHFVPEGLWSTTGVQRFYAPVNPSHVSHSIVNLRQTDSYFEAQCRRLSDLMHENGHDHLDLLKLDIEGAEFEVMQTLHEDGVFPAIVAVEFDQPASLASIAEASQQMKASGYQLVSIDRWNYTFVRG